MAGTTGTCWAENAWTEGVWQDGAWSGDTGSVEQIATAFGPPKGVPSPVPVLPPKPKPQPRDEVVPNVEFLPEPDTLPVRVIRLGVQKPDLAPEPIEIPTMSPLAERILQEADDEEAVIQLLAQLFNGR